jgi:hypothetical protein
MKSSSKILCIIDSTIEQIELEKLVKLEINIIAIDYKIHNRLNVLNVKHQNLDEFLDKNERLDLYDYTLKKYNWFENISNYKQFERNEEIEILRFMSPLEFHEFLLSNLIKLFSIKNLILHFKPEKIFTMKSISKFISVIHSNLSVEIINDNNNYETKGFLTEQIELKFNLFSKPLTFYLSKKRYNSLKSIYEKILCKRYDLWFKNNKEDIILFLEFNTSLYKELIQDCKNTKKSIVLLNNRKSALWGNDSKEILRDNNIKIINPDMFFDNKTKEIFNKKKEKIQKKINELFQDEQLFEIFEKDGITFWPIIKQTLENIFTNRLDNYLKIHLTTKNMLSKLNIKSIFCLNESGETENILLKNNKNKIPVFLLQHSFLRYNKKNFEAQWRYEDQFMYGLSSRNFLLWGNMDYEYFSTYSNLEIDRLAITGSPRHDRFKDKTIIKKNNKRSVLLTLSPISDRSGNVTINLIERYEKKIKEVIDHLQSFDNIEIIVKLHPGENWHNQLLLDYLNNFNNILVYLTKSPYELIQNAEFMITFTPEFYDSSTIMLDSLVLNKPVLQIILDSSIDKFQNEDEPILQFMENDDINHIISKCLINDEFLKNLINKIPKKLENYLSHQGNACKKIVEILDEV